MNANGTIGEILSAKGSQVWSIAPEATGFEAIQLMADKNVGALLVTDHGKLVGIISERDYTRKVMLKGKTSKETAVREIISGQLISVDFRPVPDFIANSGYRGWVVLEAEQDPKQAPPKDAVAFGLAHLVRAFANAKAGA